MEAVSILREAMKRLTVHTILEVTDVPTQERSRQSESQPRSTDVLLDALTLEEQEMVSGGQYLVTGGSIANPALEALGVRAVRRAKSWWLLTASS